MKKFLAIVLAVICTFSMATVAFAATADLGHGFVCNICGGETGSEAALNAHHSANTCGICQYCGQGFNNVGDHEYVCRSNSLSCKYCGEAFASTEQFEAHDADTCAAKYYNIPVAQIVAAIKDLFSKIDFSALLGTVKDLAGKLTGLLG